MQYILAPYVASALTLILYLAIAAVLVRKDLRTRDVGFVWLGVAVVIWPVVSRLLEYGERVVIDRLVRGKEVGFYPFTLVERGQISVGGLIELLNLAEQVIGSALLLVAVIYISRTKNSNLQPVT